MKRLKSCWIVLVILMTTNSVLGTIWQVDNNGQNGADFLEITDAIASVEVLDGDTLYVYGSTAAYTEIVLDKRLIIIGPGYFLSENTGLQFNPNAATVNGINFQTGAEGSVVSALVSGAIGIYTHSITISRCHIHAYPIDIYLFGDADNCLITECLLDNNLYHQSEGIPAGVIVSNCYLKGIGTRESQVVYKNNIIDGMPLVENSTFYNNIFIWDGDYSDAWFEDHLINCSVYSNIFMGTASSSEVLNWPDCLFNQTIESIFVDQALHTTDGKWQLAEDSPAIGAGTNGTDCGMFGGSTPYVLSGIPPIPTIYHFEASTSGSSTSGLPVHIKVKTHN